MGKINTSIDIYPNGQLELLISSVDQEKMVKLANDLAAELKKFPNAVLTLEDSKDAQKLVLLNSIKDNNSSFQSHVLNSFDKFNIDYSDTALKLLKDRLDKAARVENNGKGDSIKIPWDSLKEIGIDSQKLETNDINTLKSGHKTNLLDVSIKDTVENREMLKGEKVSFVSENDRLHFQGKVLLQKELSVTNTPEAVNNLKKNNISFNEENNGSRLSIKGSSLRKLAMTALFLVDPVAAIAIMLIPKRNVVKNEFALSRKELEFLKSGEILPKRIGNEMVLMQLDKETNEVVTAKTRNVFVPNKIDGIAISPIQKEQLIKGQEVKLLNEEKDKMINIKLDLNSPKKFSSISSQVKHDIGVSDTAKLEGKSIKAKL